MLMTRRKPATKGIESLVHCHRNSRLALRVGITLAGLKAKLGLEFSLCQSKTVGVMEMKRRRRFGTEVETPAIPAAQIRTLIDSISPFVQSLNYDIEAEEDRTRCWDCRDPAYSILARSLTARRDNLAVTIAALQARLAPMEAPTYTPIGSAVPA